MQTDSDDLTQEEIFTRLNAKGEQREHNRQTEPVVDQTMEETSRHQIDSE